MTSSAAKKDALNQITRQCENWEKDKDLFIKANEAQSELLALNLLTVLGIPQEKIFPQYKCSRTSKVDLAARFKALEGSSKFSKPDLIIEIKKPYFGKLNFTRNSSSNIHQKEEVKNGSASQDTKLNPLSNG